MTMNTNQVTLCAIYRSKKKEGMYLYIPKRDQFDDVPQSLLQIFGKPEFSMFFNLVGGKSLLRAKNEDVIQSLEEQGYYLQMPPPPEDLLHDFLINSKKEK